jgi:hypothetical protein
MMAADWKDENRYPAKAKYITECIHFEPIGQGGKEMIIRKLKTAAALFTICVLALSVGVCPEVRAQAPALDPSAVQILQRMTGYLGSLKQFSVHTQNTLEDLLASGHRVDFDISANVIIRRPNRLRAERRGDMTDQIFYYNGKTLTLYNPTEKVYATDPAPKTIEGVLDYTREYLGIMIPAADLVYRNAFPLLMQDVTLAVVVGKTFINGVRCDHLLFSRPGVDFQVWVADSGQPLPQKYVVTDTGTPALVSITTVMSDWNTAPAAADALFTFQPAQDAKQIIFLALEPASGSGR